MELLLSAEALAASAAEVALFSVQVLQMAERLRSSSILHPKVGKCIPRVSNRGV